MENTKTNKSDHEAEIMADFIKSEAYKIVKEWVDKRITAFTDEMLSEPLTPDKIYKMCETRGQAIGLKSAIKHIEYLANSKPKEKQNGEK